MLSSASQSYCVTPERQYCLPNSASYTKKRERRKTSTHIFKCTPLSFRHFLVTLQVNKGL